MKPTFAVFICLPIFCDLTQPIAYVFVLILVVNVGKVLKESLFYFGEIGGNDYNYWSLANKSLDDISKYIPMIMEQIDQSLQVGLTRVFVCSM